MSLAQTVGLGFLFSLLIEISQLLNFRASDVNDLILNTAGALGGFGIYQIGHRALGYIKRHRNRGTLCVPNKSTLRNASHTPDEDFTESTSSATSQKNLAPLYANGASPFKEALICLFALFAGNFFLYNQLVLVSLVYG